MSDREPNRSLDEHGLDVDHDQDAEPSLNAPQEARPDGLDALKEDADTAGSAGTPETLDPMGSETMVDPDGG